MSFYSEPFLSDEQEIGVQIHLPGNATAVFGNRNGDAKTFNHRYPDLKFSFLKQVHGNLVVEAEPGRAEPFQADGQWTSEANTAVGVFTADCLPILIWEPQAKLAFAVHAGWKGLAAGVLPVAFQALKQDGGQPAEAFVLIGPHIRKESFEVGTDVATQLASYSPIAKKFIHPHSDPSKKYFDLSSLALLQAQKNGISARNLWLAEENTFTESNFASYRREKGTGARQLSFLFFR